VSTLLRLVSARRDLVAHARPFLEPGIVITDVALQRAAYPMDLVDLDAGPGGRAKAYQQPHGPAVVIREIEEGWIVCATDHGSAHCTGFLRPRAPATFTIMCASSPSSAAGARATR